MNFQIKFKILVSSHVAGVVPISIYCIRNIILVGVAGSLVHMETLDDVEEDVFYFDPAPVDQDVVEGGEARLRCDVSSRRMIIFYWTLNDKPVANNSRRYQDDSDLRVVRADRHLDAGSFRCVATNVTTGIALRSAEAQLNIFCE